MTAEQDMWRFIDRLPPGTRYVVHRTTAEQLGLSVTDVILPVLAGQLRVDRAQVAVHRFDPWIVGVPKPGADMHLPAGLVRDLLDVLPSTDDGLDPFPDSLGCSRLVVTVDGKRVAVHCTSNDPTYFMQPSGREWPLRLWHATRELRRVMNVPARQADKAPAAPPLTVPEPPPDNPAAEMLAAVRRLPEAKQSEIICRVLAATASGDQLELSLLRHVLRALDNPHGWPRLDPETARTVTVEEFTAEFGDGPSNS